MTGVAGVEKYLKTFLDSWKANKSAKLMLKSDQGDLSLTREVNLGHYGQSLGLLQ